MKYVLTIDAGTGGGRAILFDFEGNLVARAHETWRYNVGESSTLPFVRECSFDPDTFWATLCRCVRQVLANADVDTHGIGAVVTTSQREGCVFLDAAGRELYAGPNIDARAALEGIEVQEAIGAERLHAITGHAPPYIFPLARFLWFRKYRPNERVHRIVMINDWMAYRLTGEVGMEPSNASESMFFDVRSRDWSDELLTRLDIPRDILPPLRQPGARIGAVMQATADATGLRLGTPVIVGGADTQVALLGSGATTPGDTATIIGSTTPVQMVMAEPLIDPAGNLWTGCHVVPDHWVLESNSGDSGSAYSWLLELLGATSTADPYATAESWLTPRDPAERRPHMFVGPAIFNLANMNPFRPAGMLFPFPLMHVDRPTRGDLVRAFYENLAFAIRANCEQIAAVASRPVGRLRASGGMSQGQRLVQTLADVLEDAVQVSVVPESAGLGCAILGAVGLGVYPSVADAVAVMVRSRTVEPSGEGSYVEQYAKWRELYAALDKMTI
jgi:autoinducer 2 (AI-2) kinase